MVDRCKVLQSPDASERTSSLVQLPEEILTTILAFSLSDIRSFMTWVPACRQLAALKRTVRWGRVLARILNNEGEFESPTPNVLHAWKSRCDATDRHGLPYSGLCDVLSVSDQRTLYQMTYIHRPSQLESTSTLSDFVILLRLHVNGNLLVQRMIEMDTLPLHTVFGHIHEEQCLVFNVPELGEGSMWWRKDGIDDDDVFCFVNKTNGHFVRLPKSYFCYEENSESTIAIFPDHDELPAELEEKLIARGALHEHICPTLELRCQTGENARISGGSMTLFMNRMNWALGDLGGGLVCSEYWFSAKLMDLLPWVH